MTVALRKSRADLTPVQRLQADAREDYTQHHKPQTAAAAREQLGQGRADAAASSTWHGRKG